MIECDVTVKVGRRSVHGCNRAAKWLLLPVGLPMAMRRACGLHLTAGIEKLSGDGHNAVTVTKIDV